MTANEGRGMGGNVLINRRGRGERRGVNFQSLCTSVLSVVKMDGPVWNTNGDRNENEWPRMGSEAGLEAPFLTTEVTEMHRDLSE